MRRDPNTGLTFALLSALLVAAGCAGTATFVSPTAPPGTTGDAWYDRPPVAVRQALERAMIETGLVIDDSRSDRDTVLGSRQMVPYVGEGSDELASGPLPVYRVTVGLSAEGPETHVRATVQVMCPSCDGVTPYEWEYPTDLIKTVFERTRKLVGGDKPRYRYPPRHVPVRWKPPRRR